jgi:plasmid stabilization system protein ParE
MPRGDKSKYTDKQKRKAEHIAEGYKKRGTSAKTAKARAWATVNAESGGGEKKGGSGYGKPENHRSSAKGGRKSQASRTASSRSAAAKKAAATRKRNASRRSASARKAARSRSK